MSDTEQWPDDSIHAALNLYVKNMGYTDWVMLLDALLVAGAIRDDLLAQLAALQNELALAKGVLAKARLCPDCARWRLADGDDGT